MQTSFQKDSRNTGQWLEPGWSWKQFADKHNHHICPFQHGGKWWGGAKGKHLNPCGREEWEAEHKQGDGRVLGQGHCLQRNKEQWAGKVLGFSVKY